MQSAAAAAAWRQLIARQVFWHNLGAMKRLLWVGPTQNEALYKLQHQLDSSQRIEADHERREVQFCYGVERVERIERVERVELAWGRGGWYFSYTGWSRWGFRHCPRGSVNGSEPKFRHDLRERKQAHIDMFVKKSSRNHQKVLLQTSNFGDSGRPCVPANTPRKPVCSPKILCAA